MNTPKRQLTSPMDEDITVHTVIDHPAILASRPIPEFRPLPPGFDTTHHLKVLAAGKTKPLSLSDFAKRIARLKKQIG